CSHHWGLHPVHPCSLGLFRSPSTLEPVEKASVTPRSTTATAESTGPSSSAVRGPCIPPRGPGPSNKAARNMKNVGQAGDMQNTRTAQRLGGGREETTKRNEEEGYGVYRQNEHRGSILPVKGTSSPNAPTSLPPFLCIGERNVRRAHCGYVDCVDVPGNNLKVVFCSTCGDTTDTHRCTSDVSPPRPVSAPTDVSTNAELVVPYCWPR
ncbi:uncharacterized protein C8Q71DRAFT_729035, partial [Rhodofomes roseus]